MLDNKYLIKNVRHSSDVVLLKIKFGKAIKFDKLCRATRLWHGSDSNVALLPCQTKFINYINVFLTGVVTAQLLFDHH